jgi:proteic killer suppression protein
MIKHFACEETEQIWEGDSSRRFPPSIQQAARRKLRQIHFAVNINDLRCPPGNRLEALKGNRKGQYSIRINNQWRICFEWEGHDAFEVEIVDYH